MKRWILIIVLCLFFIGLGIIFLTPSLTTECTDSLLVCLNDGSKFGFWSRLGHALVCVYHNVVCVLGGLFV